MYSHIIIIVLISDSIAIVEMSGDNDECVLNSIIAEISHHFPTYIFILRKLFTKKKLNGLIN